ncbi:hypothetical protein [Amycolatopsis sp. NPDC059657]|uniref:hypothetical protein n=1 Tax=Amycolatopsis sp. NPDC059657 TaxID=3346899 RepID=UPI0036732498
MGIRTKLTALALAGIAAAAVFTGATSAEAAVKKCDWTDIQLDANGPDNHNGTKGSGLFFGTVAPTSQCSITGHVYDVRLLNEDWEPIPAIATRDTYWPVEKIIVDGYGGAEVGLHWTDGDTVPAYLEIRLAGAEETNAVRWMGGGIDLSKPLFHAAIHGPMN